MSEERRRKLAALLRRPSVEVTVGGLVVASSVATLVEVAGDAGPAALAARVSDALNAVFVVELFVRALAARSVRAFVRSAGLDVVAVLPLFVARGDLAPLVALRLLRLLRLVRLGAILRHEGVLFPRVLRRGSRELFFASGLVLLTVVAGSAAVLVFERKQNPDLDSFDEAFWFALYSLVGAEPIPSAPHTLGGHVVSVFVILAGLVLFATVTGTVSAVVAERMRGEGQPMEWEELDGHLVVCGWSQRAEIVVREYLAANPDDEMPVVVVAEREVHSSLEDLGRFHGRVQLLDDDFTKVHALERAGIRRAARALVVSDFSRGRKARDADARTVLCALTIEKLSPSVYTCAEVNLKEHVHHLEMGKVNDYVVTSDHGGFLLAQAVLHKGLMRVVTELLSYEVGNGFLRTPIPDRYRGKTFGELLGVFKAEHDAILVAVIKGTETLVNPKDYVIAGGEEAVLIAPRDARVR